MNKDIIIIIIITIIIIIIIIIYRILTEMIKCLIGSLKVKLTAFVIWRPTNRK